MGSSGTRRIVHPFQKHSYGMPTLPIEEALNAILNWMTLDQPGGVIYAPPRIGKTSAIRIIVPLLEREYDHRVPVYTFQCPAEAFPTKNVFLQRFLTDIGHFLSTKGRANIKEERLIEFIALEAQEHEADRVVLIVDDAQWLTERTYHWLMDIHNRLDRRAVQLTTILFGQPELLGARAAYIELKQYQIVGRFMQRIHAFRGIRDVQDVEAVFRVMDDSEEHVNVEGATVTQAHVPDAYAAGWRLRTHASRVWDRFRHYYGLGDGKRGRHQIGMGAFMPFCRELLNQLSLLDTDDLRLPQDLVDALVEATYLDVN